jgi:hypothetical protein
MRSFCVRQNFSLNKMLVVILLQSCLMTIEGNSFSSINFDGRTLMHWKQGIHNTVKIWFKICLSRVYNCWFILSDYYQESLLYLRGRVIIDPITLYFRVLLSLSTVVWIKIQLSSSIAALRSFLLLENEQLSWLANYLLLTAAMLWVNDYSLLLVLRV